MSGEALEPRRRRPTGSTSEPAACSSGSRPLRSCGPATRSAGRARRRAGAFEAHRSPSTSTSPASGAVSPSQNSIVVVLPAPFGPSRPKHSPAWTSSAILLTATTSSYAFRSPLTWRAARPGESDTNPSVLARCLGPIHLGWRSASFPPLALQSQMNSELVCPERHS